MSELQQSGVGTPDQFKRPGTDGLLRRLREHPSEFLVAQIQHGYEIRAAIEATSSDAFRGRQGEDLQVWVRPVAAFGSWGETYAPQCSFLGTPATA